jgi:hypothetical protein
MHQCIICNKVLHFGSSNQIILTLTINNIAYTFIDYRDHKNLNIYKFRSDSIKKGGHLDIENLIAVELFTYKYNKYTKVYTFIAHTLNKLAEKLSIYFENVTIQNYYEKWFDKIYYYHPEIKPYAVTQLLKMSNDKIDIKVIVGTFNNYYRKDEAKPNFKMEITTKQVTIYGYNFTKAMKENLSVALNGNFFAEYTDTNYYVFTIDYNELMVRRCIRRLSRHLNKIKVREISANRLEFI